MNEKAKPAGANGGPEKTALWRSASNYQYHTSDSPTLSNPARRQAHYKQVADYYADLAEEARATDDIQLAKRLERRCYEHRRLAAAAGSMRVKLEGMGFQV